MAETAGDILYRRDFGSRPAIVLGGAVLVAGLVVVAAALSSAAVLIVIGALVALAIVAGGIAGFATATTVLTVEPGRVIRSSRVRTREYAASDLVLERKGESSVFVLAVAGNARKVVCTFGDDDPARVEEAFAAAGVTTAAPG